MQRQNFVPKLFLTFFLVICLLVTKTILTYAFNVPGFSTCPNPDGRLIAGYDTGTHGIVGDSSNHSGSDYVYETSETTDIQCYCPTEGVNGIQTKWWNVSGLSQEDIQGFENNGWILVPNGADWGLSHSPYLAMNSSFSCNKPTNTPTPTATPTSTPTDVPATPDPDLCNNIDGIQTSVPDGLHIDASGKNCVAFQLGGAPTPNSNGSVLGTSIVGTGIGGQVLGANTSVLADTSSDQFLPRVITAVLASIGIFFIFLI